MALWMAVFCASMTWLFSMQFYYVYWVYRGNNYPDVAFPWQVIVLLALALWLGKRGLQGSGKTDDAALQDAPEAPALPKMATGWLLTIIPLGLVGFLLPWPYNVGPWILAVGILLTWWASSNGFTGATLWGMSGMLSGTVLVVQIPVAYYYLAVEAKNHYVKLVDPVIYYILKFLGMAVSKGDGVVGVTTMRRLQPFSATWEKLGVVAMLYFFVAGVVLFVLFRRVRDGRTTLTSLSGRTFVMFFSGGVYGVLRYAGMIMLFIYLMYFQAFSEETSRIDLFYSPMVMTLSFVPLAFLARVLFPPPATAEYPTAPGLSPTATKIAEGFASVKLSSRSRRNVLCLAAAAFLMVGYHGYYEHGSMKGGRVLLDEKHSGWEKSHRPFNKKYYGHESTYNFACLLDYLRKHYDVDVNSIRTYCEPLAELERNLWDTGSVDADDIKKVLNRIKTSQPDLFVQPAQNLLRQLEQGKAGDPTGAFEELMVEMERHATPSLTKELLDDYDVLLLKNVSYYYTQEEIDAIVDWVDEGGGLYIIGEHTNVFGNTSPMNEVAREFGFRFHSDCLFEVDEEIQFEQVLQVPRLLPHPVVQHQDEFRCAVACSIEPLGYGASTVLRGLHSRSLIADYHMSNFYPRVNTNIENCFGAFTEALTVRHGEGRVCAFGDSTTYSNFGLFFPGRHEMLLGSIDWVNRRARLWWLNGLFAVVAIALVVWALCSAWMDRDARQDSRSGFMVACVVGALLGGTLGAHFFTWMNKVNYPPVSPLAKEPLRKVHFEREHSDYFMPVRRFVRKTDQAYKIFFEWVARTGRYPFCKDTLDEALEDAHLVVIARPAKVFSKSDLEKIKKFVFDGGNVLLMDDPSNEQSATNTLLRAFDMRMDRSKELVKQTQRRVGTRMVSVPSGTCTALSENGSFSVRLPNAYPVYGGEPLLTTESTTRYGRSGERAIVLARKKYGDGQLVILSGGGVFTDKGMGGRDSKKPTPADLNVYNFEYALIECLTDPKQDLFKRLNRPKAEEKKPAPEEPAETTEDSPSGE